MKRGIVGRARGARTLAKYECVLIMRKRRAAPDVRLPPAAAHKNRPNAALTFDTFIEGGANRTGNAGDGDQPHAQPSPPEGS